MPRTTMPDPRSATRGPGRAGPGLAITIDARQRVADLAAWLLSPHRRSPVVVVTVRQGAERSVVDAEELAEQRGDRIDVYLIATDDLAEVLGELLPDGCGVSGGAVRLYPATDEWHNHPEAAPLLQARDRGETDTLNSRLRAAIRSALRAANAEAANLAPRPSAVVPPLSPEASGEPTAVVSAEAGVALARHLLNPFRAWPVVVIANHPDSGGLHLPAAAIAQDLKGVAAVVELTADATYGLTDGLASRQLSVFAGAGRAYPQGRDWVKETSLAPLRVCPDPARARAVASQLVVDALTAAKAAGALQPSPGEDVTGVVQGPLGEHHVLMSVPGHGQAALLAARLHLGAPVERLVARGQQVRGRLRGAGPLADFDPLPAEDDPAARVRSSYPDGSLALARVADVGRSAATVLLHPDVSAALDWDEGGPDLRELVAVGDVVAVRVDWSGDRPRATLADPAAGPGIRPGVSVLAEGPAWLEPTDTGLRRAFQEPASHHPEEPAALILPQAVPMAPRSGEPDLGAENDRLRRRLQVAGGAVAQYAEELSRTQLGLEAAERALADARALLRKAHLASKPKQSD